GMAALAGYGVDWLERSLGARRCGAAVTTGQRWPRLASFSRRWAAPAGVAGLGLATAALLAAPLLARLWLLEHPVAAREWLQRHYLAFDRTVQLRTSVDEVYHSLLVALHPATPATGVWLVSLLGTTLLVALWLVARRLPAGAPTRLVRPALRGATLLLVALPLLASREHIHPAVPTTALEPQSGAVAYLRQQLTPPGAAPEARPLYRVYTSQPVYLYRFDVEPNVLLPLGIQEAGGYSSLDNDTHLAYAWAAETSQGRMLDVWNARYYLWPNRPDLLPSYELTSFHPQRPLVSGTAANAGAKATFRVPGVRAQDIRVLATLRDAWEVAPGTVVAWIVATDDGGREMRWPLRAGVELAEATAPPAPPGSAAPPGAPSTPRPLPVFTWKEPAPQGRTIDAHLYYSKLPLEAPRTIVRLAVEPVLVAGAQQPILRLYGLGVGQPDWSVHNVMWFDRQRYTQVYAGEQVRVYRNEQALPRAYLVPLAVSAPRERHLKEMAERAFDPARMLLVDPGPPHASGVTAAAPAPLEGPSEALGVKSWLSGESRVPGPESRVGGGIETRNIGLGTRDQGLGTSNAVRPVGVTADPSGRDAVSAAGRTTVTRYARDRVEITVDVERAAGAWLFLADQSDPNWRAYVDGAPRPVRVANALF
ncbi:MAG TPA: hypothetical protein VHN78_07655, partial [Chloroflexota bacterium]|nr:hypothetical protein [Chloroflexota bacterium]